MKFFLLSLFSFFTLPSFAQKGGDHSFYHTRPQSFTPVNDYATIFTPDQSAALSRKIQQYRDTSTNVIVIITQTSLKDAATGETYQLEEAAKHYFNNWGIGLKDKNNGVLFFIAKSDRKIRITTGKGIQNILNDNDCQDIIDEIIVPNFKQSNYYNGIDKALDKVMQILSPALNENNAAIAQPSNDIPPASTPSYDYEPNKPNEDSSWMPFIILIIIIIVIVFGIVKLFGNASNTVYNSSGSYTPSFNRRSGLTWFLSGIFLSDFFRNRNTSNNNYNGNNSSHYDNNDSYSSFDSSSSSSSDSGSSFGGGSSDGGGASGSW